jgi:hypothetical protein
MRTLSLLLAAVSVLAAEVAQAGFTFGPPTNLAVPINSPENDGTPSISADGLSLYFNSQRSGGYGHFDVWVTTRDTIDGVWGEPVNLGPTVNSPASDHCPSISADGRMLFFMSNREGGHGAFDIWLTTRETKNDDWCTPRNLGPGVNGPDFDGTPNISQDGSTLYFMSGRPGGQGKFDLWKASVVPIVDFDADGETSLVDLVMLIDAWGTDDALCDIGPMPWGDGTVDIEDLKVFMAHWEKENTQNAQ